PPMWLRFGVGDHLAALACVFAVLLALYRRERTGEGQAVASSLLGAMLMTASEVVALPDGGLTPMAHLDAGQYGLGPGDRLYGCADGWLMVAAWTAPELAAFESVAGASPEIFFATRPLSDALDLLRTAGVPCEPARENQRDAFLDDPRHAVLRTRYAHAGYGELEQVGALWDFGDLPLNLGLPPPALGQHSRALLRERGFTEAAIERLAEQGITVT
ncbi:CoA transferase, partial [Pelomonas sp. KK5]|uniref:CoA transferase n=1 Tax=Pelomonas sp. KK5 TaxID=1855730 RepID=UPI0018E9D208